MLQCKDLLLEACSALQILISANLAQEASAVAMDTTEAAAATEAQETACISGVEQDLCFLFDFVSIVYI